MGRGSISTSHGQIRILKHSTPDLLTYIQKAVQTGVYRSSDEIEEMNQKLRDSPSDLRRVRWNVQRGSKIQDYPKEYEILSLNPPAPFKPRIPVKDQKKIYSKYMQEKRPTDRLAQNYLNRQQHTDRNSSEPMSADEYYRRLLGSNKAPKAESAMGAKSAIIAKAYAVAVKQYEVMRTDNLSEKEAMEKVEELLAQDDREEKTSSRTKAEDLQKKTNAQETSAKETKNVVERAQIAFPGAKPKEEILGKRTNKAKGTTSTLSIAAGYGHDTAVSMLYSENQRSFEGMINWTKRLQAVPYQKWTVGASVSLDHWIAKRVLGLSEETWLALLEGSSPELMGRGRDIVMARHALFPETIIESDFQAAVDDESDSMSDETMGRAEDDLDALLATLDGLEGWNSSDSDEGQLSETATKANNDSSSSLEEKLTEELQAWRTQHVEQHYDDWAEEKKQEFMSWLETFVASQVPESSISRVDLEETRKNILETPPQQKEEADDFWNSISDETSAEVFLQSLLQENKIGSEHPFFDLDYQTQLERLVNLGAIRELANEYATEAGRSKFLTRYGDYLLEGVQFDHLIPDSSGPIVGSDLGKHLQEKYDIDPSDRFSLKKVRFGTEGFESNASKNARMLFMAWNQFKAGRAHYEEQLFKKGLLGLSYETKKAKK
eukprot:CAMPEP_0168174496 /NCGR_PEP_ID=MMETSP0139_2-20121125/6538_1 /TAXON_ID=44445 /ORGANISM="Pseudo-nitzschia australis, Strain 10249 10 AB" /LENGTH=662 /DNA_ID=CAMNT_0008092657 /DNA_START=130 /DNA_END=2118 /DNA_ORIENTATION=-